MNLLTNVCGATSPTIDRNINFILISRHRVTATLAAKSESEYKLRASEVCDERLMLIQGRITAYAIDAKAYGRQGQGAAKFRKLTKNLQKTRKLTNTKFCRPYTMASMAYAWTRISLFARSTAIGNPHPSRTLIGTHHPLEKLKMPLSIIHRIRDGRIYNISNETPRWIDFATIESGRAAVRQPSNSTRFRGQRLQREVVSATVNQNVSQVEGLQPISQPLQEAIARPSTAVDGPTGTGVNNSRLEGGSQREPVAAGPSGIFVDSESDSDQNDVQAVVPRSGPSHGVGPTSSRPLQEAIAPTENAPMSVGNNSSMAGPSNDAENGGDVHIFYIKIEFFRSYAEKIM
ncbi:unnamed protein product [Trichogramma brassicae]|uniref:Uncharacterized protein n=1 Tax=Trichogramma brassicae TaxID=86971 RepID=A0A6H5IQD1_9HYME|nr:unnamed protein product [Trichogramma brassicae]